jgi:hypothetical protein
MLFGAYFVNFFVRSLARAPGLLLRGADILRA